MAESVRFHEILSMKCKPKDLNYFKSFEDRGNVFFKYCRIIYNENDDAYSSIAVFIKSYRMY